LLKQSTIAASTERVGDTKLAIHFSKAVIYNFIPAFRENETAFSETKLKTRKFEIKVCQNFICFLYFEMSIALAKYRKIAILCIKIVHFGEI
jgi:hypothetical protein